MNPTTESRIMGGLRTNPNNVTLSQELTLGHRLVVCAEAGKLAAGRQEVYRELVGVGMAELCQQVERCRTDPPRCRFVTRTLPRINGAMLDHLAQDGVVPLTSHGAKLERQARREGLASDNPKYLRFTVEIEVTPGTPKLTREDERRLSSKASQEDDVQRGEYSPMLKAALDALEGTGNCSLTLLGLQFGIDRDQTKLQLRDHLAVEADLHKRQRRTRKK